VYNIIKDAKRYEDERSVATEAKSRILACKQKNKISIFNKHKINNNDTKNKNNY
jgi:hypothetical protein